MILAIETSCDETAVAVLRGKRILSSVVYSQIYLHRKYGGVVPSVARLAHEEKFDEVLEEALNGAGTALDAIEVVAVTVGPGLAIALEVGLAKAKEIAKKYQLPLLPVNHMEGHLLSVLLNEDNEDVEDKQFIEPKFPALGLLVSGKHSEFILVKGIGDYEKLGQTLDDAAGEAFDKASVMLGLGYPGGPRIAALAEQSDVELTEVRQNQSVYLEVKGQEELRLPIPMLYSNNLNLSFSGLKTALKQKIDEVHPTGQTVNDLAKLFQATAISMLIKKLVFALESFVEVKQIWVGGGVIANRLFREELTKVAREKNLQLLLPPNRFTGDNAAMIGAVAAYYLEEGINNTVSPEGGEFESIDRQPRLSL